MGNIIHSYQRIAKDKGLVFNIKTDAALSVYYELDEAKLKQILGNLISNAIKFTEKGRVDIEIHKISSAGNNDRLRFKVADTGEGIPEDDLNDIFESFSQTKPVMTRKQGGTGLGLAIVKKLVELHGSDIYVNSKSGQGSEFYFDLDLKKAGIQKKALAVHPDTMKGLSVLVADDNEINAFVIGKLLGRWGIITDHALNGKEAIEKAKYKLFDLILMDIHMPGMNGFDTAASIRKNENLNKATPIFALTADVTAAYQAEYASYFNGFLSKPLEEGKLFEALAKVDQAA